MDYFGAHALALKQAMDILEPDCPRMVWNTATFRCMPSGDKQSALGSPGGFSLEAEMTLSCLVSDFGSGPFPVDKQQVTYPAKGGSLHKIAGVTTEPGGRIFRIRLESAVEKL
jgi:hypothetical protein